MVYCKKFISGIQDINAMQSQLFAFAYQNLQEQCELLRNQLATLPEHLSDNEEVNAQLALYREKQEAVIQELEAQRVTLEKQIGKETLNQSLVIENKEEFVEKLALNFRNIRHLADTLSDAPPVIKQLQTTLYVKMLSQLSKSEQEEQLQTLSEENLYNMIGQAVEMYDNHPDAIQLRENCRELTQMAYFELIRKNIASIQGSADQPNLVQYAEWIDTVRTKMPNVGSSSILDNMPKYKSTDGASVIDLLENVGEKLSATLDTDFANSDTIRALRARKAFLEHLKFGQEARKSYAGKVKNNLTRDLFWGRNIRDIELFAKSKASDLAFSEQITRKYFQQDKVFKLQTDLKKEQVQLDSAKHDVDEARKELDRAKNKLNRLRESPEDVRKSPDSSLSGNSTPDRSPSVKSEQSSLRVAVVARSPKKEASKAPNTPTREERIQAAEKALNRAERSEQDALINYNKLIQVETHGISNIRDLYKASIHKEEERLIAFKLEELLDEVKSKEKTKEGFKADKLLEQHFNKPTITLVDGVLKVYVYHINESDKNIIQKEIASVGRYEPSTRVLELLKHPTIPSKIHCTVFTGPSLEAIEEQIKNLEDKSKKTAAETALIKIREDMVSKNLNPDIKSIFNTESKTLKLDNDEQVLIRKLFELKALSRVPFIHTIIITQTLQRAFKKLDEGHYKGALSVEKLEETLTAAYQELAKIDLEEVPPHYHSILENAKLIGQSAVERKAKSYELSSIFESNDSTENKIQRVYELFNDEYQSLHTTLGLADEDMRKVGSQILEMSKEIVTLIERIRAGQPAITPEEEATYFDVLQQIAQQSGDLDFNKFRFKVKHGATGEQLVHLFDEQGTLLKSVTIKISMPLPYSLTKPLGGDLVFSYGGSRGVVSPFEGLDEAYKSKRFASHSRVLGVGQYGTIKQVESLLTSLNYVIKKGFVSGEQGQTFTEQSRNDLRTRPITSRDDPNFRIESDVLKNLFKIKGTGKKSAAGAQYWIEDKESEKKQVEERGTQVTLKQKPKIMGTEKRPQEYHLLSDLAVGESYADTANKSLNLYSKGDELYHDPTKRAEKTVDECVADVKEMLSFSKAIVEKAEEFSALGFSHGDIKPENFNAKRNEEGSYDIEYIDWATGGFQTELKDNSNSLEEIFKKQFGNDLPLEISNQNLCRDKQGRFVQRTQNGVVFGIKPTLEIMYGARQCTLPYISPKVLSSEGKAQPKPTVLEQPDDPYLDDWALTAMTFGICNRHAYFELVKGRVVNDYVVPMVLEPDDGNPPGLKITDRTGFNKFFACGDEVSAEELSSGEVYSNPHKVMYIPSNQREGEPLHLYRRLEELKKTLEPVAQTKDENSEEHQIIQSIDKILSDAHQVVASGQGYTKSQLKQALNKAQECIRRYEKLHDAEYQKAREHASLVEEVLKKKEEINKPFDLLMPVLESTDLKRLEVLCSYPRNDKEIEQVLAVLSKDHVLPEQKVNEYILSEDAPCPYLLRDAITNGQERILSHLLGTINSSTPNLITYVEKHGLLHYTAQEGMSSAFSNLVHALKRSGASEQQIFNAMMKHYGPQAGSMSTAPQIKWSTNCFHIAIRNNNAQQLETILSVFPKGHDYDSSIYAALHLSAVLGNKALYKQIKAHYETLNPEVKLDAARVLRMIYPPDNSSPYHLFMADKETLEVIDWDSLQANKALSEDFLFNSSKDPDALPLLVAAREGNINGLSKLIQLGDQIGLSRQQWSDLFQQKDSNGKNVINYLLEKGQLAYYQKFLQEIKTRCDNPKQVILHLLQNPHPVNPLKNFLALQENEAIQFQVIHETLDVICKQADNSNQELQQARVVALLVNQEWLIQKAEQSVNHRSLRSLLLDDALSLPYQKILLEQLVKGLPQESKAHGFYQGLLKAITPRVDANAAEVAVIELPKIVEEVSKQRADLNGVIEAILAIKSTLQQEIQSYQEKLSQASAKITTQEQSLERLNIQLGAAADKLAQAQKESEALKKQAQNENDLYETTRANLEEELERLKLAEQEAQERIQLIREHAVGVQSTQNVQIEQAHAAALVSAHAKAEKEEQLRTTIARHLDEHQQFVFKFHASEKKIEGLTTELELREQQITLMGDEAVSFKQEATSLSKEREELVAKLENRASLNDQELTQLKEQLTAKDNELGDLRQRLSTTDQNLSLMIIEIEKLSSNAEQLSNENAGLRSSEDYLKNEVNNLNDSLMKVGAELHNKHEEISQLKNSLEESERKLISEKVLKEDLEEEIKETKHNFEEKISQIEKEFNKEKENNINAVALLETSLATANSNYQQANADFEVRALEVTQKLGELESLISSHQRDIKAKDNEIGKLNTQLIEFNDLNARLIVQLDEVNQSKAEAVGTLTEDLNSAHAKIKELEQGANEAKSTLADMTVKNSQLTTEVDTLNAANKKLLYEVKSLENKVSQFTDELKTTRIELANKKAAITELENSLQSSKNELSTQSIQRELLHIQIETNRQAYETQITSLETRLKEAKKQNSSAVASLKEQIQKEQTAHKETNRVLEAKAEVAAQKLKELEVFVASQKESINESEAEVATLSQTIKQLSENNARLVVQLAEANQSKAEEVGTLTADLNTAHAQLKELEKEANDAKATLAEISLRNTQLSTETQSLSVANSELLDKVGTLENKVSQFTADLETTRIELANKKAAITELENSLQSSKDELVAQSIQRESLNTQIEINRQAYETQITSLETQLKEAKEQNSSDVASLKEQIQKEQTTHQQTNRVLEAKAEVAAQKLKELEASIESHQGSITQREAEVGTLRQTIKQLSDNNENLMAQLVETKQLKSEEVEELTAKLNTTQGQLKELQEEANIAKGTLAEMTVKNSQLTTEVHTLSAANTDLLNKVVSLENKVSQFTADLETTRKELANKQAAITELEKTLQSSKDELVTQSTQRESLSTQIQTNHHAYEMQIKSLEAQLKAKEQNSDTVASLEAQIQKEQAIHKETQLILEAKVNLASKTLKDLETSFGVQSAL